MSASLSVFTLYRDPAAAVGWLIEAFGFTVVNRFGFEIPDPEGHQWSVGTYRPGQGW